MLDVTVMREIARPAAAVAAYAFEPENDPSWIGGIKEVRLLTGRPVGIGTQVERVAYFMGRRIEYVLEVVGFIAESRMDMRSIKAPFPMVVGYEFTALTDNRAQARLRVQGGPKSFLNLLDLIMAPMVRRNLRGDLRRLAKILEST